MKYGYYPGCSLERNAAAYDISARAVAAALGFGLDEIDDWNCCGATEYIAINKLAAYALVSRNLALAQKQLHDSPDGYKSADGRAQLVAPCSACFLNLRKADRYLQEDAKLREITNEALAAGGLHYDPGTIFVRHLLEVIVNEVGYGEIKRRVVRPLAGLRVAPYYGCLIVRPRLGGELSDPEYPTELDRLMKALGAEVVDFPLKTHCCGGHMTQISMEVAYELIRRLLQNATDYHADAIVTLCPMCQLNLDAYQTRVNQHFGATFNLPILYFTQMMGLAFGLEPKALGFGKEIVSAEPALKKIGAPALEPQAAAKPPRKPRKKVEGLPMPRMLGEEEEVSE
ncbi:MAG: CoB--CoM heterodisulfide reductase iron-sulfur subunit B family protein [Chloroflexota bacterium]